MQLLEKNLSSVTVITVNYCTADLVCKGLDALNQERQQFPNLHVIVVDNASPDNSVEALESYVQVKKCQDWVKIIRAERNGGYAYGNNVGFEIAKNWQPDTDYIWMLNPDTEVLPGATAALVNFLQDKPGSIVGSRLQDADGTPQISTFNFPSCMSEFSSGLGLGFVDRLFSKFLVRRDIPTKAELTPWLAGASLMLTASTLEMLGEMDEGYFLYFEEVDYLLNAKKKNIRCWYIPDSKVIHEVGASTGISDARKKQPRRPQYWFDSRRRYFIKNHGRMYFVVTDFFWLIAYAVWLARKYLLNPEEVQSQPPRLWLDLYRSSDLYPLNWFR